MQSIRSGISGARAGIHAGNQVVGAAQKIDRVMSAANERGIAKRVQAATSGMPPPPQGRMDRAAEGYAAGKTAHAMSRYYARTMPRDAPGPRTAASYAYRYGIPSNAAAASGTTDQRELLSRVRQHHAAVNRTRNLVGSYRDMSAPSAANRVDEFASSEEMRRRARRALF